MSDLKVHKDTAASTKKIDFCQFRDEPVEEVPRNFQCDRCPRKFATAHVLKSHVRNVHSPAKMAKCDSCGKEFKNRQYLNDHIRRHHRDRRHCCKICPASFISSAKLEKHGMKHS
jgi:KRAB domain-containing zinc finger protein